MQIVSELSRRNVIKVGAAYLVVAWVLVQVAVAIAVPLRLPDWFATAVIVLLAIGFPVSLVMAWAFELTPEGVKLAGVVDPEKSRRHQTGQKLNYLIIGALSLAVVFLLVDRFVLAPRAGPDELAAGADFGSPMPAPLAEETGAIPYSIAILPFETLSNTEANVDFAEGVYEEDYTSRRSRCRRTGSAAIPRV
jgi:hypothetical protein